MNLHCDRCGAPATTMRYVGACSTSDEQWWCVPCVERTHVTDAARLRVIESMSTRQLVYALDEIAWERAYWQVDMPAVGEEHMPSMKRLEYHSTWKDDNT